MTVDIRVLVWSDQATPTERKPGRRLTTSLADRSRNDMASPSFSENTDPRKILLLFARQKVVA